MPSSSKKQHNFMAAVAHSPAFARKVGVPQSVGKDFTEADKGRKMKRYAPGGKVDWSANEANAMKPGEKQLGYGKPTAPKSPKAPPKFPKGKGSFNRDSITAEGRAKGVDFDKYGRVKAPSSVASDMVKKGAKFALDASPFGGISKAGESVKKLLTTKTTKRPESVGKGELAYRNDTSDLVDRALKSGLKPGTPKFSSFIATNGGRDSADNKKKAKKYAEGGNVYSDEDEGSEQSKKNIADTKVAQSKAEDAKGKLNPESKRGFFGSLFTGHLKDYNAQEKRKKELQSTFGGMKSAKTMEAEKSRADLDRPDKLDLSGGVETKEDVEKRHKEASDKAAASQPKKQSSKEAFAAAKGKPFPWNGKKYSGAMKGSAPKKSSTIDEAKKQGFTFSRDNSGVVKPKNKTAGDRYNETAARLSAEARQKEYGRGRDASARSGTVKAKTSNSSTKTPIPAHSTNEGKNTNVNQYSSEQAYKAKTGQKFNRGGSVFAYKKGGLVGSRADGIASRGRTKCKIR